MSQPSDMRTVIYDVPEHEILLSFNNDDDAYDFRNWLSNEGWDAFQAYKDELC